ncbi:hypothetical protein [Desulfothermobacter acidiphilus]|uniref:hypothetical protein n=1 Tax=Desulfothermobacter acidiphilus TaxID=1938353 RepID=UPI003F8AD902
MQENAVPGLKPRLYHLACELALHPGEEKILPELRSQLLNANFRIKTDGKLILTLEENLGENWVATDKTACHEGVTMWQCLLQQPRFRTRVKNPTEKEVHLSLDALLLEREE